MNISIRGGTAAQRRMVSQDAYTLPVVRLPIYLRLALMLMAVMVVILVGWVVLVGQQTQPANPFAGYAEMFPGQPQDALTSQDYICGNPVQANDSRVSIYCRLTPGNGPFWEVSVVLKNGMVQRTDFAVHEGDLNLGDLMFLWGRPKVRVYKKSALFEWPHLGISGTGWADNGQFSYYMPVTRVFISPLWNRQRVQRTDY